MEKAIHNATQELALPPLQPTLDPAIETGTPPPIEDVQPEPSTPMNRDTGGTKIPRALARLLPHNTAGEKEILPPRRPGQKSHFTDG
ncbi:hypothetical protein DPMN_067752 [Dreissena polymorpha]|uniref:Uncharacterized protein n=1 Tax=Dreissena polymorpha TaxID=45954 RepID=A0A9D4BT17_DREPO|nr:hypothetical protein DPMN_067752 [Dreissena polymorpha]